MAIKLAVMVTAARRVTKEERSGRKGGLAGRDMLGPVYGFGLLSVKPMIKFRAWLINVIIVGGECSTAGWGGITREWRGHSG